MDAENKMRFSSVFIITKQQNEIAGEMGTCPLAGFFPSFPKSIISKFCYKTLLLVLSEPLRSEDLLKILIIQLLYQGQ